MCDDFSLLDFMLAENFAAILFNPIACSRVSHTTRMEFLCKFSSSAVLNWNVNSQRVAKSAFVVFSWTSCEFSCCIYFIELEYFTCKKSFFFQQIASVRVEKFKCSKRCFPSVSLAWAAFNCHFSRSRSLACGINEVFTLYRKVWENRLEIRGNPLLPSHGRAR